MTIYRRNAGRDVHGDRAFTYHVGCMDAIPATASRTLNDIMDMDHVIRVHADGSITEPDGVYAPEVYDGEVEGGEWSLLTGYSRQDHYSGPGMHDSEYVGGGLADHIIETPGYYVVVACVWQCTDGCEEECAESHTEGWAVAFKEAEEGNG